MPGNIILFIFNLMLDLYVPSIFCNEDSFCKLDNCIFFLSSLKIGIARYAHQTAHQTVPELLLLVMSDVKILVAYCIVILFRLVSRFPVLL